MSIMKKLVAAAAVVVAALSATGVALGASHHSSVAPKGAATVNTTAEPDETTQHVAEADEASGETPVGPQTAKEADETTPHVQESDEGTAEEAP